MAFGVLKPPQGVLGQAMVSLARLLYPSLLVVLGYAPLAHAIVHDKALSTKAPVSGLSGALDAAILHTGGNIELTEFNGALTAVWQDVVSLPDGFVYARRRINLSGSSRFTRANDENIVNQAFAYLRYTHMWNDTFGLDAFSQLEYDPSRSLRRRTIAGAGVQINAPLRGIFRLWGGTHIMPELENIDQKNGVQITTRYVRSSSFLATRVELTKERSYFQNTIYVQPRINYLADTRILDIAEILCLLSDALVLSLAYEIRYDNQPPQDIKSTDTRLSTTLRLVL